MEAQSRTLAEWAELWERESFVGDSTGYSSVVVALRKASYNIAKVVDPNAKQNLGLHELPEPEVVMEVRED
jgi:hypothetical protein